MYQMTCLTNVIFLIRGEHQTFQAHNLQVNIIHYHYKYIFANDAEKNALAQHFSNSINVVFLCVVT